jgi:type VI protein secretion system component VasK
MPIERMTVDIFHKTAESYLKRAHECLAKLGVPEPFTRVFLQPVTLLHELGLHELKRSFEHHWKMNIYPQIMTVFSKFPFTPEEKAVVSLDEVNAILHPKSKFYNDIEKMISIFCYLKEGRWVPIDSNRVGLEASIYDQLNRITKVTHTLWDFEGVPKPLVVKVSPIPFAEMKGVTTVPVKSCIMAGTQSIHNINQDPSWQSLNIDWWKADQSLVGMTVVNKTSNSKSYRSVQPPTAIWSFFALLKEGERNEGNIWRWKLPTREGQDSQLASFHFETNPQELLNYQD